MMMYTPILGNPYIQYSCSKGRLQIVAACAARAALQDLLLRAAQDSLCSLGVRVTRTEMQPAKLMLILLSIVIILPMCFPVFKL